MMVLIGNQEVMVPIENREMMVAFGEKWSLRLVKIVLTEGFMSFAFEYNLIYL